MTADADGAVPGTTVGAAVRETARQLDDAGLPNARLDARLLVAHAAGLDPDRLRLDPDRPLPADASRRLETVVERRATAREPVSRILGTREFWSLTFAVTPETLDPRPDSETLVEAALAAVSGRTAPSRILDLGTGTGCLLLALLSELPAAQGIGIDVSQAAVATAHANAKALGLEGRARFTVGDWSAGLDTVDGRFGLVVSNPPYIPSATVDTLEPEVARHDPRRALDGGADGLDAYRAIAALLPALLAPGGVAALEIGAGQHEAVPTLVAAAGLTVSAVVPDLAGTPRCVVAKAPANGPKNMQKPVARAVPTC